MNTNRREMLTGAAGLLAGANAQTPGVGAERRAVVPVPDKEQWLKLDVLARSWWQEDQIHATEADIRGDETKALLFLPFPYVRISVGPKSTYQAQFPFDTAFKNYALFAHDRLDIVRNHLLNHLFMIERYGFAPNANLTGLLTRSQAPLLPTTLWRYYALSQDKDLLYRAYPLLKQEYLHYWNAPHHQTPTGLATNRDLGDSVLSPELASGAELLDWMPVFGSDIRRCIPLGTNCALVNYARVLSRIAGSVGLESEARQFSEAAVDRAALIRKYCWCEGSGMFLEYDYVAQKQLPYVSEFAYWTLWAGVATREQASRLAQNIRLLEKPYGLSVTDKAYPDPHAEAVYDLKGTKPSRTLKDMPPLADSPEEYTGGRGQLMWMYPAGWGSTQIIVTAALDAYGYKEAAKRISGRFLKVMLDQHSKTGQLWEKYNVADGSLVLPNARYGNIPYHSFTAAALVLLGRRYFDEQLLQII